MNKETATRRGFLGKLTGWLLGLGVIAQTGMVVRSLVPNVLYEPPRRFKIGAPDAFPSGVKFLADHRLYIFREGNSFHAISAICSHLGCTVKYAPFTKPQPMEVRGLNFEAHGEFKCPCHGSLFHEEGTNYDGPAPKALKWYELEVTPEDGELVVDLNREVDRDFRLVV